MGFWRDLRQTTCDSWLTWGRQELPQRKWPSTLVEATGAALARGVPTAGAGAGTGATTSTTLTEAIITGVKPVPGAPWRTGIGFNARGSSYTAYIDPGENLIEALRDAVEYGDQTRERIRQAETALPALKELEGRTITI